MARSITVNNSVRKDIDELSQFAYRINGMIEHSSTFCSKNLDSIYRDFDTNISSHSTVECRQGNQLIGVLDCYIDDEKSNIDCSLLIEPGVCYEDIARRLFDLIRKQFSPSMKYTFFFPKENINCSDFLDKIGAHREVNEYGLLLKRGSEKLFPNSFTVIDLPGEQHTQFVELHDNVFPGIYISGKNIVNDIGKKHFVFTIIDNGQIIAYSVLRLDGGKNATAELVAVREDFRHKGYGRAILSHLITQAHENYGIDCIQLIVDGDNENAIHLYLELGFVLESENCCYTLHG